VHLFCSLNHSPILADWILGLGISNHVGNFGEFCEWPWLKTPYNVVAMVGFGPCQVSSPIASALLS
jgi:hypothetical protein